MAIVLRFALDAALIAHIMVAALLVPSHLLFGFSFPCVLVLISMVASEYCLSLQDSPGSVIIDLYFECRLLACHAWLAMLGFAGANFGICAFCHSPAFLLVRHVVAGQCTIYQYLLQMLWGDSCQTDVLLEAWVVCSALGNTSFLSCRLLPGTVEWVPRCPHA